MNKAVKNLWIKALESNKYKQTTGTLKRVNEDTDNNVKHCCLGVLTDIYCKVKHKAWDTVIKENDGTLSDEVIKWAGLPSDDPDIQPITVPSNPYKNKAECLTAANDCGLTFKQIAKIIKKEL